MVRLVPYACVVLLAGCAATPGPVTPPPHRQPTFSAGMHPDFLTGPRHPHMASCSDWFEVDEEDGEGGEWVKKLCPGDLDGDGDCDLEDFGIFQRGERW
jgi:hypothetical protein